LVASDQKWKWVSIGYGCLELPAEYRVVWESGRVDAFAGYIEPPERNWRMTWKTGLWQSLLVPSEDRFVEWTRTVTVNGKSATLGVITVSGESLMVIGTDLLEFALTTEIPNAEALLAAVYSRHRFSCQGLPCEPFEKSTHYRTF
jgi:hypothetical protein